jgi:hypothetical protein
MNALVDANCARLFHRRLITPAAAAAVALLLVIASPAASAPQSVGDWFVGTAVIPAGQSSPVQIDASDVVVRPDGAVGIGYGYQAAGQASGALGGTFVYHERGYLYFTNPSEPSTFVGSRFTSGVFNLTPTRGGSPIQIADTAPDRYTSGIQTVVDKTNPVVSRSLRDVFGHTGPLTYGYFTFTDQRGTFTGYATADFTRFAIQIAFDLPN